MKKRRPKKCQVFEKTTRMTWDWHQDWKHVWSDGCPVVIAKKLLVEVNRLPTSQVIRASVVPLLQGEQIPLQCHHGPEALHDVIASWPSAERNTNSRALSNIYMLFGHVLRLWLRSCFIIIVLLKVGYQRSKFGRLAENAVTELAQHRFWTDGLHSQDSKWYRRTNCANDTSFGHLWTTCWKRFSFITFLCKVCLCIACSFGNET